MDGRTVELEKKRVLCCMHKGPYPEIGSAIKALGEFIGRNSIPVENAEWLAIFHDDPKEVKAQDLRSDACVTVADEITLPEEDEPDKRYRIDAIPAGKYATTRHLGSYEGLPAAWNQFISEWVPSQGLQVRQGYCFEIYLNDPETVPADELITDIYEPVE